MLFKSLYTGIRSNDDKQWHTMMTASLEVKAKKKAAIELAAIYSLTILAYFRAVFISNLLCSFFIHAAKIT